MARPRHGELTPPELAVMERLLYGRSNKEIGKDLHRSPLTIQTHMQRICRKLGAENRTHALAMWLAPERFRR